MFQPWRSSRARISSRSKVRTASRDNQDRVADANARAGETLNAMHTVQSYAREAFEAGRFGEAILRSLQAARKRIRMQAALTATFILLVFGGAKLLKLAKSLGEAQREFKRGHEGDDRVDRDLGSAADQPPAPPAPPRPAPPS